MLADAAEGDFALLTARVLAGVPAEFATLTGVPTLINTSLDFTGQPICGTRSRLWTASSQRFGCADGGRLVDRRVKIGYSFWGFLGPGVTDTPDGGRSYRRVLVDGLHVDLLAACLRALELFRLSRQLDVLDQLLAGESRRNVVV